MRTFLSFLLIPLFVITLYAQEAQDCHQVTYLDQQDRTEVSGDLSDGCVMDLDWAQKSSMACFPGTRFIEFSGNHLLYAITLPAQSEITISVTPHDSKDRINVYALRLGINNPDTPPNISSAISCEASYPLYAGKPNLRTPNNGQSVEFMSITKSYQIVIGVAGAKEVLSGAFDLDVEITSR